MSRVRVVERWIRGAVVSVVPTGVVYNGGCGEEGRRRRGGRREDRRPKGLSGLAPGRRSPLAGAASGLAGLVPFVSLDRVSV